MSSTLLVAVGCSSNAQSGGPDAAGGGPTTDAGNGQLADAALQPADAAPAACDTPRALPIQPTVLTGFSGAEDFAFDLEGNLVSADFSTNMTRQKKTGRAKVFSPSLGDTAGTRFLANGDLVVAAVEHGALIRIAPNGASTTVLSGIAYPNGVEVGKDGFVYVAEHDAGNVRRIHPDTGAFTIIASGLTNPNGVSFSPDYRTLYIGSFGDGTVHSVTVDGQGNWGPKKLFGTTPGAGQGDGDGFGRGGLDGLTVDACGNVYVTEFEVGLVWRFAPSGGNAPELVFDADSAWIPNMHWGTGVGGWDSKTLYVMDRDSGRLFAADLGVAEKTRVYP
jgi:sugar lactone lactonase YvrE